MDRAAILAITVPALVAALAGMWPAVTVPGSWADRERTRQVKTRQILAARALRNLREVRARLDEVFHEADAGRDIYLRRVDPGAVSGPVSEYARLMKLQQGLSSHTSRATRGARALFWFLVVVLLVVVAGTVLALALAEDLQWITTFVLLAGVVPLLVGASIYFAVLIDVRAVDKVHRSADSLRGDDGDDSYDDIIGPGE